MQNNVSLKQIAAIYAGYPFRGKIPEVQGGGVVALQMKDVALLHGVHWSGCTEVELTGKRQPDWLRTGDILFVARGNHNYSVMVEGMPDTLQAVAAPHFYLVRCNDSVLPEYLVWLLNQRPCQHYFEQNAEGSVTKSIRRSVLENTPVTVPPLTRQQPIVALVNTLRQEQRLLHQLVQNGERMMNALAKDLINNREVVK